MIKTPMPKVLGGYFLSVSNVAQTATINLLGFVGNSASNAPRWLQIHQGVGLPPDGTVPSYTFQIEANQAFQKTLSGWASNGLVLLAPGFILVVSTTKDTLTADVAATWDIGAVVEDWEEQDLIRRSVAGDLTQMVNQLQVWSEVSGLANVKNLYSVELISNALVDLYAVVYAVDAPSATSRIIAAQICPAAQITVMNFGRINGISPVQMDIATGAMHRGCTIYMQVAHPPPANAITPGELALATVFAIRAYFS